MEIALAIVVCIGFLFYHKSTKLQTELKVERERSLTLKNEIKNEISEERGKFKALEEQLHQTQLKIIRLELDREQEEKNLEEDANELMQRLSDMKVLVTAFREHTKKLSELEMFYQDQSLMALIEHATEVVEALEDFSLSEEEQTSGE